MNEIRLLSLIHNQQFLVVEVTDADVDLSELHEDLTGAYNSIKNTDSIILNSSRQIYYLILDEGMDFSLNEIRHYLDDIAICYTTATE